MNQYVAIGRFNGQTLFTRRFPAGNRVRAVYLVLQWFWAEYRGKYGPANQVVTVSDPYEEVVFTDNFNCNDKRNNYLDEQTIVRVLASSNGKLLRETRENKPHHPRRTFRRNKRRRVYLETVAPNILCSPSSGVLYCRTTEIPQISKDGQIVQKRVMQNVRLSATTLPEAVEEIKTRGLLSQLKEVSPAA